MSRTFWRCERSGECTEDYCEWYWTRESECLDDEYKVNLFAEGHGTEIHLTCNYLRDTNIAIRKEWAAEYE